MYSLQSMLLLTIVPLVYCDDTAKENNLTTRNNEDGLQGLQQDSTRPQYQPILNSEDAVRPIMVQRYPYLIPDERVYQPYPYKVPTGIKYPSWPAPVPWPPKYPPAKPEDDKEDLEKSFLKVMYPAIIICALGSLFIPILIIYNYKSIYGLVGGTVGGCGCGKRNGRSQSSQLNRSILIANLVNLMVTIEKALSEVEHKFMIGPNKETSSSSSSSSSGDKSKP